MVSLNLTLACNNNTNDNKYNPLDSNGGGSGLVLALRMSVKALALTNDCCKRRHFNLLMAFQISYWPLRCDVFIIIICIF